LVHITFKTYIKFHVILLAFRIGLQVIQNGSDYQSQPNMHPKINTKYNLQIIMRF